MSPIYRCVCCTVLIAECETKGYEIERREIWFVRNEGSGVVKHLRSWIYDSKLLTRVGGRKRISSVNY